MAALPVTYEQEGGIVILTLNEPETRNALSPEINDMLVEYVAKINKDYSVGCVIVTGAGEGFSSGGNVKRMQDRSTSAVQKPPVDVRRYYTEGIQRVPVAIYNLEAPIIAAVNGAAIGAGLDLATMCDIRIAARSAKFAESFARVGLVSGDGGAWFLPRAVGMSKAFEMTFTGDFLDGEEAARHILCMPFVLARSWYVTRNM
jgi:enoyl-CoA hydratase/carnithine racemase